MKHYLTTGEAAEIYAQPEWRLRRTVDSLGIDIPRAGRYRLILLRSALGKIAAELERRGLLAPTASQVARILAGARQIRETRRADWHDYEIAKRELSALLGFSDAYDQAIRDLTEALDL